MIYPLIMAGGTGTRFWPKSRSKLPKQFLEFFDSETLLQACKRRADMLTNPEQVFVVTNLRYAKRVLTQLPTMPEQNILKEPLRRDTAACVGFATAILHKQDPAGIMVIIPSDHYILDDTEFLLTMQTAIKLAEQENQVVTIGIEPTEPKTGYGYIQVGESYTDPDLRHAAFHGVHFTEKPDLIRAKAYLAAGNYLWNCGIFVSKVSLMYNLFAEHMPSLFKEMEKISSAVGTPDFERVVFDSYKVMDKISIDFGIMEKLKELLVVKGQFGWDDVGSWGVLQKILGHDEEGNAIKGIHIGIDTQNCIIDGDNKLVATLGVKDLIIVQTKDVILICDKKRDQEVKELVKMVKVPELRRYF